ncbi:MAG: hypothetical protein IJC24_02200, partial [Clostridia bacterium]|nr:hypothetical protein [Clostridia bacterium]
GESNIADSDINLIRNCLIFANSSLYLNECKVVINSGSELLINKQLHTGGRTTLVNKGVLDIASHDGCSSVLGGTIENKNIMDITYPPEVVGTLINNGRIQLMDEEMQVTGSLENHGEILMYNNASITGNLSGNPVKHGTEWIYR